MLFRSGEADLAIGTERISRQIEDLDFIPLLEERFDFVIKKEMMERSEERRVGSSARILLDTQLKRLGIPASKVKGYDKIMKSHLTMAAAVASGEADLAIGTERISRQIEDLDFIPLLEERYDFVIKKELMETEAVQKLLKVLNSPAFRLEIAHFSGNDYRDLGRIVCEV